MAFAVKEERRGCWKTLISLRGVRRVSFFFFFFLPLPSFASFAHCEIQIWGWQNRVITFDLASFELQMFQPRHLASTNQGLGDNGEANLRKLAGRKNPTAHERQRGNAAHITASQCSKERLVDSAFNLHVPPPGNTCKVSVCSSTRWPRSLLL